MHSTVEDLHGRSPTKRRERILSVLRARGAARVADLAAELGVSVPTIRRDLAVLEKRGMLAREHGGAVLSGAAPSPAKQSSVDEEQLVIGMVVPRLQYYFPEVIRGAKSAADAVGARFILRESMYERPGLDREQAGLLFAKSGIHGLLIAPELRHDESQAVLAWLDSLPIPVVLVERQPPSGWFVEQLQWVATDHRRGGQAAVEHLHQQGHRRIGFFGVDNVTGTQVRHGWHDTLLAKGIDPEEQLIGPSGAFSNADEHSSFQEVVRRVREGSLTALIVQPDPDALALGQRCQEQGIRIPEDLAIVAYDDEIALMGEPPMSAVRPPKFQVGHQAMTTLISRIRRGPDSAPMELLLRPRLNVRGSSVGHGG